MIVTKAFGKGLVCRGYHYHEGLNTCEQAKCVRDGFHAAEDPLDCLDYYDSFDSNEFWVCEAGGDIDEDGRDSKISCTELTLLRRLNLTEFVTLALIYLHAHPQRRRNRRVHENSGVADRNHFAIVEGNPDEAQMSAVGMAVGDILGFYNRAAGEISILLVDGKEIRVGKAYGPHGEEVLI